MRGIRRSYPEITGFRRAEGVLDLRQLWHARRSAPNATTPGNRTLGPGLSALSASVLGKPLDKSMQARVVAGLGSARSGFASS